MQNTLNLRTNGVCPSIWSDFQTYSSLQVFAPTGGTFGSPGSLSKTLVTKQGKNLHKQLGQEETTNGKIKLFWVFGQKYIYKGIRLIFCWNTFAWAKCASLYGNKWSYKNKKIKKYPFMFIKFIFNYLFLIHLMSFIANR